MRAVGIISANHGALLVHFLLVGLLLVACTVKAVDTSLFVDICAATAENDEWQMFFDADDNLLYVFKPDKENAVVRVQPKIGWSWYKDRQDSTMRMFSPGPSNIILYGRHGEAEFVFKIKSEKAIAYIKVDRYLGIDMIGATAIDAPDRSRNMHDATVVVMPESNFVIKDKNPYKWFPAQYMIVNKDTVDSETLVFSVGKKSSISEGDQLLKVTVEGHYKELNVNVPLTGKAKLTIVKADVEANGLLEDKEDDPGVVYIKNVKKKRPIKFSVMPRVKRYAGEKVSLSIPSGGSILERSANVTYRSIGFDPVDTTVDALQNKTFYLGADRIWGGELKITHPLSGACDAAKVACWGLKFITPSGSPKHHPVNEEADGQNEFCYDENEVGVCRLNLKIGVFPSDTKGLSISKLQSSFNGYFELPYVEDVAPIWSDSNQGGYGIWKKEGESLVCSATACYKGLPYNNSSFGLKSVKFVCDRETLSSEFEIFFPAFAHNHPPCRRTACDRCANWFYYWRQGAVRGLGDAHVFWSDALSDKEYEGEFKSNQDGSWSILLSDRAVQKVDAVPLKVNKYTRARTPEEQKHNTAQDDPRTWSVEGETIGMPSGANGIKKVAATLAHEKMHYTLWNRLLGKADSDGDGVADELESAYGFVTYTNDCASYHLSDEKLHQHYYKVIDDEIRARKAEQSAYEDTSNCDTSLDWAVPGENFGD